MSPGGGSGGVRTWHTRAGLTRRPRRGGIGLPGTRCALPSSFRPLAPRAYTLGVTVRVNPPGCPTIGSTSVASVTHAMLRSGHSHRRKRVNEARRSGGAAGSESAREVARPRVRAGPGELTRHDTGGRARSEWEGRACKQRLSVGGPASTLAPALPSPLHTLREEGAEADIRVRRGSEGYITRPELVTLTGKGGRADVPARRLQGSLPSVSTG